MDRKVFGAGALLAMIAVALGAFGAHALKERISPDMLEVFRTGVNYHLAHSFAILICGVVSSSLGVRTRLIAWLFGIGILLFGGSLYALSISGIRTFGMITPLGGVAFLSGWLVLTVSALKQPREAAN